MGRLDLVSIFAAAILMTADAAGAADVKKSSGSSQTSAPSGVPQDLQTQRVPTVSPPDLSPVVHGPSQAEPGKKLGRVTIVVRNKGHTLSRRYRVELFLKQGSAKISLGSASGKPLAPNTEKKHLFTGIKLGGDTGEGSHQLCARVSDGGEGSAQQRNNESCSRLTIAATDKLDSTPALNSPTRTASGSKPRKSVAQGTGLGRSLGASAGAEPAKPAPGRARIQRGLNQADKSGLDRIVRYLTEDNETAALSEWRTVVDQVLRKPGGMNGDVDAWIEYVMHEAYSDGLEDLKFRVEKAGCDQDASAELRVHIADMREQFFELNDASKAPRDWPVQTVRQPVLSGCDPSPLKRTYQKRVLRSKRDWEGYLKLLNQQLGAVGAMDNSMRQMELQQLYQNYNQAMSTLSAIMKSQHDALKAIISNMR